MLSAETRAWLFTVSASAACGALAWHFLTAKEYFFVRDEECATPDRARRGKDSDDTWIALAHAKRCQRVQTPSQSNFRVTAVVVFRIGDSGRQRYVVGHNDEACCLVNSACAERAAFLQLTNVAEHRNLSVTAVYLVSDAPNALSPGPMCREYMLSSRWTTHDTRIVMEGVNGPSTRLVRTLGELWPHASVHTRHDRDGQLRIGEELGAYVDGQRDVASGHIGAAWRAALRACETDGNDHVHPVSYGAAVIFEDGSEARASQKKALEYGCSLDAVCQLAPAIEASPSPPAYLCMSDHFGVCHAPFAPARAYLLEHGYGACRVLCHDEAGKLHVPRVEDLVPHSPNPFAET
eukprot:TRINITY_DN65576_c0_g1_i1.p1 TRINITY_DN65576_c0_g1~~TRINITY_DN65576_c0_g1_i1.p1  ORF type:complete len:350 (+),score=42.29 TRINITY_DN65576_c0_g1_i1:41-1090(+)